MAESDKTQEKILWGIGIAVILIGGTWITIYNVREEKRFKREQAERMCSISKSLGGERDFWECLKIYLD